jgi:hypothetical protein
VNFTGQLCKLCAHAWLFKADLLMHLLLHALRTAAAPTGFLSSGCMRPTWLLATHTALAMHLTRPDPLA